MMGVGDTVQLKSGGPTMVIIEVILNEVECIWITPDHKDYKIICVPKETLVIVP
jgi:uncharacterized protein YodC (DUF2158 family)